MLRKTLCCILCCIAILCLTATTVFAESWYWYDGEAQNGSIAFDFNTGSVQVTGGAVELRQVAYYDLESNRVLFCEGWEDCGLSVDELLGDQAAEKLYSFAKAKDLPARTVEVGADGTAKAEDLPMGVWLVSQDTPFDGCLPLLPSVITIPMMGDDGWIFAVEGAPKVEPLVPETTLPSHTEPTPPDLPPTGQVNWPLPLMVLGGCFLILLGICLRRDKRHETRD